MGFMVVVGCGRAEFFISFDVNDPTACSHACLRERSHMQVTCASGIFSGGGLVDFFPYFFVAPLHGSIGKLMGF